MGYSFLMPKTLASAITVAGAAGGGQQMLAVMQRWASNRIHLSDHLRPASDSTCHRKHAPEFNVFHYEILISANERQIPVRNLLRVTTVTILAGVLFLLPFVCLSVSSIHQCKTYMYSFSWNMANRPTCITDSEALNNSNWLSMKHILDILPYLLKV